MTLQLMRESPSRFLHLLTNEQKTESSSATSISMRILTRHRKTSHLGGSQAHESAVLPAGSLHPLLVDEGIYEGERKSSPSQARNAGRANVTRNFGLGEGAKSLHFDDFFWIFTNFNTVLICFFACGAQKPVFLKLCLRRGKKGSVRVSVRVRRHHFRP